MSQWLRKTSSHDRQSRRDALRLTGCVLFLFLTHWPDAPALAQPEPLFSKKTWQIAAHGGFDIRGRYGKIPPQTTAVEPDYTWWTPGRVGFWGYRVEGGFQIDFRERITTRLTLTTYSPGADRDFAVWGNEVRVRARLKEASIRLDRVVFEQLALSGGRQPLVYPLFTDYDYTGGQLIWAVRPGLTFDWGQWQVFEGRTVDQPGTSSDDIDLYGPRLVFRHRRVHGQVYGLIHSKAGGFDGIGQNIKIIGLSSAISGQSSTMTEWTVVWQHGKTSTPAAGERRVRAYAFHGRLQYRFLSRFDAGAAYWSGSGDRADTPQVNEAYQAFGYRNTLDKFTFFYRPGLADLRLFTGMLQGSFARMTGRLDFARIRQGAAGTAGGEEIGLTVEYAHAAHVRLRWRWAATFDGHRMQVYEMSAGF